MKKIPSEFKSYFWDIDFDKLQFKKDYYFIIKRVLDHGNTAAIKWLVKQYPKEAIKSVLLTSRDLSRITANFWSDVYHLDKAKVPALQKLYDQIPWGIAS